MPPRSNPGSIVYDHFGWTILITEESLENISIYLEGQLPSDAAPPSPQKVRHGRPPHMYILMPPCPGCSITP